MTTEISIKWSGQEYNFVLENDATVLALKEKICEETRVLPHRQKLLGLKNKSGKLADDDCLVGDLAVKPGTKYMMMG